MLFSINQSVDGGDAKSCFLIVANKGSCAFGGGVSLSVLLEPRIAPEGLPVVGCSFGASGAHARDGRRWISARKAILGNPRPGRDVGGVGVGRDASPLLVIMTCTRRGPSLGAPQPIGAEKRAGARWCSGPGGVPWEAPPL